MVMGLHPMLLSVAPSALGVFGAWSWGFTPCCYLSRFQRLVFLVHGHGASPHAVICRAFSAWCFWCIVMGLHPMLLSVALSAFKEKRQFKDFLRLCSS
jgi:hypothetical protein